MPSINENSPGRQDSGVTGRKYWRSVDELADTPEFRATVEREFPEHASELLSGSRRGFLKIMSASVALAGFSGCLRWPDEKLASYAHRPAGRMDGVPVHYATAFEVGGVAQGLLVSSVDGRPIKIEGNPTHPLNMGATNVLAQASVLDVYDFSRSRGVLKMDEREGKLVDSTWGDVRGGAKGFASTAINLIQGDGAGFAILSEASRSPSVSALWAELKAKYPKAQWVEYEPTGDENQRNGTAMVLGKPYKTVLDLSKADVIVSLDADLFNSTDAAGIKYAREFAQGRRLGKDAEAEKAEMNRLYVIESVFTNTGAAADHRRAVRASEIGAVAQALLAGEGNADTTKLLGKEFLEAILADLGSHKGSSVVVAGERQPAEVHAAVAVLNGMLGNIGKTVIYYDDRDATRSYGVAGVAELVKQMNAKAITSLVILGGNPVYNMPADLKFAEALKNVATKVRVGMYADETSALCDWHVSQAHYLEAWGDVRTIDGTVSIVQPMIEPLFEGKSVIEVLAALARQDSGAAGYDIVRQTAGYLFTMAKVGTGFSEYNWKNALYEGLIAGSGWSMVDLKPSRMEQVKKAQATPTGKYELVFLPDNKVFDGRFANNGWLQELPDPMTRHCWDNAALVNWKTYEELAGLVKDQVVTIEANGVKVEAPLLVLPGLADGVVAVALGYGRTAAGHVGTGVGFDSYKLRTSATMGYASANVVNANKTYEIATVQAHFMIDAVGVKREGALVPELVREYTFEEYRKNPAAGVKKALSLSLWNEHRFDGYNGQHTLGKEPLADKDLPGNIAPQNVHKWGMAIDLSSCTGCSACVVACQSENNVPVVGREQVLHGREMHWIRIDRYFRDAKENPVAVHQPVMCMHCENAPCEEVCPVAATTHSQEGINMMTYNRCIGTRYCSNNCPYKVRRFNFFDYNRGNIANEYVPNALRAHKNELEKMQKNPDVTVRTRGVMEKCNYCVQRIEGARILAKREGNRVIADGEIKTACQQACPTSAITFGDLQQDGKSGRPLSKVFEMHGLKRSYGMLDPDLNTKPRSQYLVKVRNPSGTLDEELYKETVE